MLRGPGRVTARPHQESRHTELGQGSKAGQLRSSSQTYQEGPTSYPHPGLQSGSKLTPQSLFLGLLALIQR